MSLRHQLYSACLLFLGTLHVSLAKSNAFIYPMSLHWHKGQYVVGDRGLPGLLSFYPGQARPSLVYTTQDSNRVLDIPLSLTGDGNQSIVAGDPGVCALSQMHMADRNYHRFSPPSTSSAQSICPRFVVKSNGSMKQSYVFTSGGNQGLMSVDASGNQQALLSDQFISPYGIAEVATSHHQRAYAVADAGKGMIKIITSSGNTLAQFSSCDGRRLRFPFGLVFMNNKLYFDDAVTHRLYAYDYLSAQCVMLTDHLVKPLGLTKSGDAIGIIDAGSRSLSEYRPRTASLVTLYHDTAPLTTLIQPWGVYVTPGFVYISDYKRGGIAKINKRTHRLSMVVDPGRGKGAPLLTAYALAGFSSDPATLYLSDATQDVVFKVNAVNGDHDFFRQTSGAPKSSEVRLSDPTAMVTYRRHLFIADIAESQVDAIDPTGKITLLSSLSQPPMDLSRVVSGHIFVTQPAAHAISRINIATGKATRLSLQCPASLTPIGIDVVDKTIFVASVSSNAIYSIDLATPLHRCKRIVTINVKDHGRVFFLKRYDKNHVIVTTQPGSALYLVNINTHRYSLFSVLPQKARSHT